MIYVYAIVEGRHELPDGLTGFGGAPLHRLAQGDLEAVYSSDPPSGVAPSEDSLWLHERVLEELMATRAVLPMRFGSTIGDEGELRELLTERHEQFARALAIVRGRVEIGVRATAPPDDGDAERTPASGREYLAAKLERRRAAARMGEDLHAELASLSRASRFRLIADPRPVFAGSYLVDRAQVDTFRRGFEAARAARPGLALACTGPWPPFSFTDGVEGS